MDGWMDGCMDGWMDAYITAICKVLRHIFPSTCMYSHLFADLDTFISVFFG